VSLQPISPTKVLLAGVILSGCGAPETSFGGLSPASEPIFGEASNTTEVIPFVQRASPAQLSSQGPPTPSRPLQTKPRLVPGQAARASPPLRPGTPIFGPFGLAGTVTSNQGRNATVIPRGGGAAGVLVPRSRSTGTLFLPGRPPVTVTIHP